MGDGGSAGDPQNNAQNLGSLLGKILRIDVRVRRSPYASRRRTPSSEALRPPPGDLGARRCATRGASPSTARRATSTSATSGRATGRRSTSSRAGSRAARTTAGGSWRGTTATTRPPAARRRASRLPVAEYSHAGGDCSVTGGFVLSRPRLRRGLYGNLLLRRLLQRADLGPPPNGRGVGDASSSRARLRVSTFGEDEAGEIYVADYSGGVLYRLTDAEGVSDVLTVPVVVDVVGAVGAHFMSELTLGNRGTADASVDVTFTAAAALGSSGSGTVTEIGAPGPPARLPDVLEYLRQKGLAIPAGRARAARFASCSGGSPRATPPSRRCGRSPCCRAAGQASRIRRSRRDETAEAGISPLRPAGGRRVPEQPRPRERRRPGRRNERDPAGDAHERRPGRRAELRPRARQPSGRAVDAAQSGSRAGRNDERLGDRRTRRRDRPLLCLRGRQRQRDGGWCVRRAGARGKRCWADHASGRRAYEQDSSRSSS